MNEPIFLAAYDMGVARALPDSQGNWTVEKRLENLRITCLAADPSNSRRVYAGAIQDGVWRSDDCGLTWEEAGLKGQDIKSLAVSPHDPAVLYAGTKGALMFRSTDAGASWSELKGFRDVPNRWWWFSPAEPPDFRPYVIAIAPSPTDPQVLLAGIEFGAVVRSEDGGETWSRHRRGALRDCHSMKFHHSNGDWSYQAGGSGGGASFSRDGGKHWQKAGRGLAKKYGIVCGADAERPEVWYVCVGSSPQNAFGEDPSVYLYRSSGGAGWEPIGWQTHPLPETPTALVTIPGRAGHLYAGLKGGNIWHSANYGDTWRRLPVNMDGIWFSLIPLLPESGS